jgi:hypothetical protein
MATIGHILPNRQARAHTGTDVLGRPITVADAQTAAICPTRNTKDFEDTAVELVDPRHLSIPRSIILSISGPRSSGSPGLSWSRASGGMCGGIRPLT